MRKRNSVLALFVVGFTLAFGPATGLGGPAKSKKLNTNLYEQDSGSSVSGKVKAVREIQEETEVFLDAKSGGGGPYVLPQGVKNRAAILKTLTRSQKPGGPSVKLEIDDQQRIKGVEELEESSTDSSGDKWEF